MSKNWPVIVMRVFAIPLERFLPNPASPAKPTLNYTQTALPVFGVASHAPRRWLVPSGPLVFSIPVECARLPGTHNVRVCTRGLARRERQGGVWWKA